MTEPRQIAVVRDYAGLLDVMRQRVNDLGINYAILDNITCYTDTYATKLLGQAQHVDRREGKKRIRSGRRSMSQQAFDSYLAALGFDLVAVENPHKVAKLKEWLAKNHEGRLGPKASMLAIGKRAPITIKISLRQLKERAKRGGKMRAEKLPARRRQAIARKAAKARWRGIANVPTRPEGG